MTEVIALIHPVRRGYGYDVLYRLSRLEERSLRRSVESLRKLADKIGARLEVKLGGSFPEYDFKCPLAKPWREKGWNLLCSGDTDHGRDVLEAMGLTDENDLEGLVKYLKSKFKVDKVLIMNDEGEVKEVNE